MTKEIIKGNKLILEFEGWKETDSEVHLGYMNPPVELRGIKQPIHPREAKYHSSWDWLDPVIQKIASCVINDDFHGHLDIALKQWRPIAAALEEIKPIDFIFPLVVNFLQWYNSNNPTPGDKTK